jgi:small subunit ribosomal protein S1
VQPGEFVQVAIEALEDCYGETRLSREKAKRLAAWHELEAALEQGKVVQGLVNGKVKGGLTVMINGIRAFLPGSLVDLRPVKDTNPYEGKQLEFKVIKPTQAQQRGGLAPRSAGSDPGPEREALLSGSGRGGQGRQEHHRQNIRGPGQHRWLAAHHSSAWRRVKPCPKCWRWRQVEAKVLKFDQENRVSLGLKQWAGPGSASPAVTDGTRLFGKSPP